MSVDLTIYGMTGVMIKTPKGVDYDDDKFYEKYNYFEDQDSEFDVIKDDMCGDYFAIGKYHFGMDSHSDNEFIVIDDLDETIDVDKLYDVIHDLFGQDFPIPPIQTFVFQHWS